MHVYDKKSIPSVIDEKRHQNASYVLNWDSRVSVKTDTTGNPKLRMFKEMKPEMNEENAEEISEQKFVCN